MKPPWLNLQIVLVLLAALWLPSLSASELNFDDAARIVIQSGGRKKPLDTFASESLQTISGRRALKDPQSGQRLQAMDALISMWSGGRDWKAFPVVLVSDASLKRSLGLPATLRLFSFEALARNHALGELEAQAQATRRRGEDLTALEKEAETVLSRLHLLNQILSGEALTIVPSPKGAKSPWAGLNQATAVYGEQVGGELGSLFKKVSDAYRAGDAGAFASSTREFRSRLSQLAAEVYPAAGAIEREVHYNRLHPFRWAWLLYLGAFFGLLVRKPMRFGLVLFGAGLAMQIYGFVLRSWVAGRAPVTNMYESVVWVSLGVAAFALGFALIYRSKLYVLTAAPLAILGLIFADSLPSVFNSSIGPLPPVLRDNFWLVTHVLTITLGYAAFALAMGLGHVILSLYLFKPASVNERSQIHQLLYRALQIGVLLLAVGTILGGVWANYSWGRFWGWDPKETWALIALLLYIFALHGRLAGWWGNFGLSVAAAVCFNGVLMAWYGVNFVLGKGLHSYGFGGGGVEWVAGLVALDVLFIGYCVAARLKKGGLHQNFPRLTVNRP
ncbi:MAG: cytochrome c biogenesis protein CcsA [Verrucomicrobia bacterium]|nr:cytochrome c biogenesis protein CcsA [Verrucomicrobiota bacterium]